MPTLQSPQQAYTPRIREPLPLPRTPVVLPPPPEPPDEPSKIDWLQTLLPPLIMMVVLSIVATLMQSSGFIFYTMVMIVVYPLARGIAYIVQKNQYDKKEEERKQKYQEMLEQAERAIVEKIRLQRKVLNAEYLTTDKLINQALAIKQNGRVWYRAKAALDFLALRMGLGRGRPCFEVQMPKGPNVDERDPLLEEAHKLKGKYSIIQKVPYLLDLPKLGSVAILGNHLDRYQLAHRLLLDALIHHRPDELEIIVLSTHQNAASIWGWLRWSPHCRSFFNDKEYEHLVFGTRAVKIFLGRFERNLSGDDPTNHTHKLLVVDVDGIQQYDDEFIQQLILNAGVWNTSLLFVGGDLLPHSVRGLVKFSNNRKCVFVDTKGEQEEGEENDRIEDHIILDQFSNVQTCERVTRKLARLRLLGRSGETILPGTVSLFDVLQKHETERITYKNVIQNWSNNSVDGGVDVEDLNRFENEDLLLFPLGLVEKEGELVDYPLNLLEARFGGKDAYHTMLIGTTGSGKSEFIKSLILGAIYKYPPQYLNFFCMDFKGGSTVDQLEKLPHVVGVMTNLDETLAQRGLIAIRYEIDRRQAELKQAGAKDIWEYNEGLSLENRMPHLVLVLDEFTRGLDMLANPAYNLQDLLEKRLVPQGRSLGVYLLLANQVANAKVHKLLPNVGWKIALKVASDEQMRFIDKGLKSPRHLGRGYIKPMGEEPIEFQCGYSGYYVKYLQIKHRHITLSRFLPNGRGEDVELSQGEDENDQENEHYLEMNQLIDAVEVAIERVGIPSTQDMYLKPLPRSIKIERILSKDGVHRIFNGDNWSQPDKNENFLSVPIGFVDIVHECKQHPLKLEFQRTNPALWVVGTQSDVIAGLRTILFSLAYTHTPEEIQFYMLEFGTGLREIPEYPHRCDVITDDEIERIERTVRLFEDTLGQREEDSLQEPERHPKKVPSKFLIVNNIAGLKAADIDWFQRVMILIQRESHKYGIHVLVTSLPRAAGARVSAGDLKIINSRIVFPSINPENYWQFLDVGERKLPALTNMDDKSDDESEERISRSHWLSTNDSRFQSPLEMQICEPSFGEETDSVIAEKMKEVIGYAAPQKIGILEEVYPLDEFSSEDFGGNEIFLGISNKDLEPISVKFEDLPTIWGVGGPKESGKTNFLTTFVHNLLKAKGVSAKIHVLSMYPSGLTKYCEQKGVRVSNALEKARVHLEELREVFEHDNQKQVVIILEDIHLLWERSEDKMIDVLDELADKTYDNPDIMFIVSFSYPGVIRTQRLRNVMVKLVHDNRTGICLSYEDEWALDPGVLLNYKRKLNTQPPPGRGFWVLKGKEHEIQTFHHSG